MIRYIRVHTSKRVTVEFKAEKYPLDYTVDVLTADINRAVVLNIDTVHELMNSFALKPIETRLKRPTLENIVRLMSLRLYRKIKNTPYLLTVNVKVSDGNTFAEAEFNTEEVILNTGGAE